VVTHGSIRHWSRNPALLAARHHPDQLQDDAVGLTSPKHRRIRLTADVRGNKAK
jgi:hypothetical protein